MARALTIVAGWLQLCSTQLQQPELAPESNSTAADDDVCIDDPSWLARTTGTPCARIRWDQCATTRSDARVTAAQACAVTCGTCALLSGVANGAPCVDDDAWRATNGRSCQTIRVLSQAVRSYDRTEQCAGLRSGNLTAAQACPQTCETCTATAPDPQPLESVARVPLPADSDDVGLQSDLPTSPRSTPSSMELPADQVILLRTPLGTHLPIETARWNLTGGAAFATIDITTLGTFWGAQQLETVLHIPPACEASVLLPSDAFVASPGVYRTHGFVNVPRTTDSVGDWTQDLIELQLLPYNSTTVPGAVLDTLRSHLSQTASELSDTSHDGADVSFDAEWREIQSQFQLLHGQLPGQFLMKLYGGHMRAFGGVRCLTDSALLCSAAPPC
eukprot:COSAG02_NODE_5956_length_3913_cov_3.038794_4_plen_389_part_00